MTDAPTLVVFDLDDTLYPYEPCDRAGKEALFRFASDELGVKAPAFADAYAQARVNVKERLGDTASSHSRLLYCHEALELIGLRSEPQVALVMEQEYWRNYLLAMQLRPGVVELLQSLRYNDVATAVVTDLTAQIQFRKLYHLDIAKLIDHVVCSEETAQEKASLQPFRLLASRVAPSALECVWFVGDRDFDAPVDALVEQGVIKDGRGFVHGASPQEHVQPWRSFREIEQQLERAVAGQP
ncbi:HAD family hydrolase [Blastococcus sp. SYSU D00669]